jgi:hypothetical protein
VIEENLWGSCAKEDLKSFSRTFFVTSSSLVESKTNNEAQQLNNFYGSKLLNSIERMRWFRVISWRFPIKCRQRKKIKAEERHEIRSKFDEAERREACE